MAKRIKQVPVREPEWTAEDSLLIRSAESIGRVIGTLQRQLDKAKPGLNAANRRRVRVKKTTSVRTARPKLTVRAAARKSSATRGATRKK
jgi:hypothetical protein